MFKRHDFRTILAAGIGSFTGVALVAYVSLENLILLLPSLGASAVLLFAASHTPMARPRNVFWGHLISAGAGVAVSSLYGITWWSLGLGVSLAILGMLFTDTLHPPGGATAFTAIAAHQGWLFIITPVALGALWLLVLGWLVKFFAHRPNQNALGLVAGASANQGPSPN